MKINSTLGMIVSCLLMAGCSSQRNISSSEDLSLLKKEADELHKEIVSVDTHTDAPLNLMDKGFDISKPHDARVDHSKIDFPRMKAGGLDAVFFAAFVAQGPRTPEGNESAKKRAKDIIDTVHAVLERNKDVAALATSSSDAAKLKLQGRLAIYLGIENGYAIGNDLSLIRKYYDMGVRYMTLCHTKNNDICDSSTDPDTVKYKGLSELGKKAVEEMNNLGMIIDVSHISDEAFYDVLKYTKTPVIASHSSARALCNSPRDMDDEMLRAIAKNDGVVQICILTDYIKEEPQNKLRDSVMSIFRQKYANYGAMTEDEKAAMRKERAELDKKYPRKLATVSDAVDHIDHIVSVCGIDHAGIGTDFDGGGELEDCYDVSEMKNITVELLKRGYSHADVAKIWGGNFFRVFKEVETYASGRNKSKPL
ncbi:MAG: membrane dipeptidase [Ignavibacteria bacterium]|jgi:membrane dipeptidase|nr:membrane dipeptidase [Ignavibacteria bacterium]MCU7504386.1 membrane dipeptidase [Ignavibacteria bacterium]MCU7517609.1 membrane dipeptidase [Ignavibacteria bacterium]